MRVIKKLTIQLEDSDGNIESTDIDGVYVTSIEINRPLSPFGFRDSFFRDGPDEITIKMLIYGGMWVGVTTKPPKNITPSPKRLPSAIKQLPEHKDE